MQLLVTVKQGEARIVRCKVDIKFLISAQHNHIFHDPGCGRPRQLRYLKTVSMKVNGMDIVTGILHVNAIALALEQVMRRRHRSRWKHNLIDRPQIESALGGIALCEPHLDGFVGLGSRRIGVRETRIIPSKGLGRRPEGLVFVTCILHHNAHSVAAIIVGEVAHHPDSGIGHMNDRGNALCCSQPQPGYLVWSGHRVAIQRNHLKRMSRKSQAANFRRASIQNMKQDALACFYSHRFAMAQHATIDREVAIANLKAVGHALCERGPHCRLATLFEFPHFRDRSEKVLGHISTLAERGLKLFQREEDFAVVVARVVLRLDINRADLAAVLPSAKIGTASIVGVIEAQARRLWSEGDGAYSVRRNIRSSFLCRAIDIG